MGECGAFSSACVARARHAAMIAGQSFHGFRMSSDTSPPPPGEHGDARRNATLLQVVAAVFGSFLGIRKGNAMQRDAVTIKPVQVVIVGVIAAALFVLTLVLIVRFIVGHA